MANSNQQPTILHRYVARMDALDRPWAWSVWDDKTGKIAIAKTGLDKGAAIMYADAMNQDNKANRGGA